MDYSIASFVKNFGTQNRSSRSQMIFKIGVVKSFAKFQRKIIVLEPRFNKVAGLKACNFTKKRLQHFVKFLRTPFL